MNSTTYGNNYNTSDSINSTYFVLPSSTVITTSSTDCHSCTTPPENDYEQYDYSYDNDYGNATENTTEYYDYDYTYDDDYFEQYLDENVEEVKKNDEYKYEGFAFERPIYLYLWPTLVIFTTLVNVLVVLVLIRKRMRNATNVILVAIAITDSLTGLVTVPLFIRAYSLNESGTLLLTKNFCESFMVIKYFVSRGFHTMSIWLTVLLGMQRFVSVTFPFRAHTVFSMTNTMLFIIGVGLFSPFLHIYHAFNSKTANLGHCDWHLEEETCGGGCVYLWLMFFFMHFFPCIFLILFSVIMIVTMNKATLRMKNSQMISNVEKLHKRTVESRRISGIVIAVVVVFLIPEVPHSVFVLVFIIKHHLGQTIPLETNRSIIAAYEILVVLSFHANFWIYLVMNRKFRSGLNKMIVDPVYALLTKAGVQRSLRRRSSVTSSFGKTMQSEVNSHMFASRSRSNSFHRHSAQFERKPSRSQSVSSHRASAQLEMKTYTFKPSEDSDAGT